MLKQARRFNCRGPAAAAVGMLLVAASTAFGQTIVLDEGLTDGAAKPESNLVRGGAAIITEPVAGSGDFVLQLTDALGGQSGVAWFDVPFNLRAQKVVFQVQMFIWSGSRPPADGISAIFQFFGDADSATRTTRIGGGGGGLGTSNFPTDYVSVAWDTWDNEEFAPEVDPENSIWDAAPFAGGGTHSAHVEVNQNLNPGGQFSLATNIDSTGLDVPYMIDDELHDPNRGPTDPIAIENAVGDIWGPDGVLLPVPEYTVTFESGFITVELREITEFGGEVFAPILYDPNPGPNFQLPWNNRSQAERTIILTALDDFPADANAILGFAASTGGAWEKHEVDNIRVTTFDNPREIVDVPETARDCGAINVGGEEVEATIVSNGSPQVFTFLADRLFNEIINVDVTTDPNQIILNRASAGLSSAAGTGGDTATPVQNLNDPSLETIYQSNRNAAQSVDYQVAVPDGRYQVHVLLNSELPSHIAGGGPTGPAGVHAFDVNVEGTKVLGFFSPAEAAGVELGTAPAVQDAAVLRTFQVDVTDGFLDVSANSLIANASINGIAWCRIGDSTGEAATGDLEDNTPAPFPAEPEECIIAADFTGEDFTAPTGMQINVGGGAFTPQLFGDKLQMLDDTVGSSAVSAFFTGQTVDLSAKRLKFSFDVQMEWTGTPADGVVFAILGGNDPTRVGGGGGANGFNGIGSPSLGIEFDLWSGGGAGDDSGFNDGARPFGHMAILGNSSTNHLQDQNDFDSTLDPPNWIDFNDPIHVEGEINNGFVRVFVETPNFARRKVLERFVPHTLGIVDGHVGFTGGTGGATVTVDIDNVQICLGGDPSEFCDVNPVFEPEPPIASGAINCGGPDVVATLNGVERTFIADRAFGADAGQLAGGCPETRLAAASGFVGGPNTGGDADSEILNLQDPSLDEIYRTNRWGDEPVVYHVAVPNGRYAVHLLMNADCPCHIDGQGLEGPASTQFFNTELNGETVLSCFAPAEAAADELGNPNGAGAVQDAAVIRSFEVDVTDGLLVVSVLDLGNGNPPENAVLNGLAWDRIGDTTGAVASGQTELNCPNVVDVADRNCLVETDFDDQVDGACPVGWVCNIGSGGFVPQVDGGRLKVIDDATGSSAVSAYLVADLIDLSSQRLVAEFDITMASEGSTADGVVFAIVDFNSTTSVGGGGGANGFAGGSIPQPSLGVEFDLWNGGGAGDDTGFNSGTGGHIALVDNASVGHVQDQNDFDPSFVFPASFDLLNPAGLHVEVVVEAPRVQVWASGISHEGNPIPRRKVLDAPSWAAANILEGVAGFTGGTGGATADAWVDNLSICTGASAVQFVNVMGGLGASADEFISPLGEDVPFTQFGLTTDAPLDAIRVVGSGYTGAGAAPTVASFVNNGDGRHVVTLDNAIEPGNWLRLDLEVTGAGAGASTFSVWLAHQPLDVNQDGETSIRDATAFGEVFRGSGQPLLININGDASVNVRDATAFGNNWNGIAPLQAWRNTSLPSRP